MSPDRPNEEPALGVVREIGRFLGRFWWVGLLTVPFLLVITIVHETAHAAVAMAQGATIEEFVWLPSGDLWGYVSYTFPAGAEWSSSAISLAPYGLWLILSLATLVYSRRFRTIERARRGVGALIFTWFFVLPIGDIANAAMPYLLVSKENDWFSAFGPPSWEPLLLTIAVLAAAGVAGHRAQRNLLGDAALSVKAYAVLGTIFLVGIAASAGSVFQGLFGGG